MGEHATYLSLNYVGITVTQIDIVIVEKQIVTFSVLS